MKTWIIVSGVILWTGTLGLLWLNYYEQQNKCILDISSTIPFMSCQPKIGCDENDPMHQAPYYFPCDPMPWAVYKPLILLYPQSDIQVNISLEYAPWFSATYPEYDGSKKGWSVLAHPDGTLLDSRTHQDTYGLFWEGNPQSNQYDLSHGFVIKWSELRNFLYSKLTEIGLNTKEKSDFIMFWYPKLQEYPYIQITFAWQDYTDTAKLSITPTPDTLLRVFIVAKPLTEYRDIPKQKLKRFERKWFSMVEWGGTIVE
jgi:hypothetical protein